MTFRRQMIKYRYDEIHNNNVKSVEQFVAFFDKDATVEIDEEYPSTMVINGKDNMIPQRIWNGDYLIFDDEDGKTFSVGTTDDDEGWSLKE